MFILYVIITLCLYVLYAYVGECAVCLYQCLSKRQRESVFVYDGLCVRLGVPIHNGIKTPLTCAVFQEKRQGQGTVALAACRFPSYIPSSH